jgi:hypothetical protein
MIEIKLPQVIKIGGFDYSIETSVRHNLELRAASNRAEFSDTLKRIRIDNTLDEQHFSESFIHEIVHAVDGIYCNWKLSEDENSQLSNGLFQILEQIGVRFVK